MVFRCMLTSYYTWRSVWVWPRCWSRSARRRG